MPTARPADVSPIASQETPSPEVSAARWIGIGGAVALVCMVVWFALAARERAVESARAVQTSASLVEIGRATERWFRLNDESRLPSINVLELAGLPERRLDRAWSAARAQPGTSTADQGSWMHVEGLWFSTDRAAYLEDEWELLVAVSAPLDYDGGFCALRGDGSVTYLHGDLQEWRSLIESDRVIRSSLGISSLPAEVVDRITTTSKSHARRRAF